MTRARDPWFAAQAADAEKETWRLVERYVEHFPDDWRLIFQRGDELLELSLPEELWRGFD